MNANKLKCPCCGYFTLLAPQKDAVAFICPVCFWENDVCLTKDDEPSDENGGMTLREARKNYALYGACAETARRFARQPSEDELDGGKNSSGTSPCMEDLWACTLLMQAALCSMEEYNAVLDKLFLQDDTNELLHELMWCSRDALRSIRLIDEYFKRTPADMDALAAILTRRLRDIYLSGSIDIREFAHETSRLWGILPQPMQEHESLSILAYADEPLNWLVKNPEKESRALYEKALGIPSDIPEAESERAEEPRLSRAIRAFFSSFRHNRK